MQQQYQHLSLLTDHCFPQVLNDPLHLAFSAIPLAPYTPISSGVSRSYGTASSSQGLPANVHLLTLKWLSCSTVLVRLSHIFEAGEHVQYSKEAAVNLHKALKLDILSIQEATLFGNRLLTDDDLQKSKYDLGANLTHWHPPLATPPARHSYISNQLVGTIPVDTQITLHPMQVRTFYITVRRTHSSSCVDPPKAQESLLPGPTVSAAVARAARGAAGQAVSLAKKYPGSVGLDSDPALHLHGVTGCEHQGRHPAHGMMLALPALSIAVGGVCLLFLLFGRLPGRARLHTRSPQAQNMHTRI